MFNFIKQAVISIALVCTLANIVAFYLKLSLTPHRLNTQQVHPMVFEYSLALKGYDPFQAKALRRMYENGQIKVDENGMFI